MERCISCCGGRGGCAAFSCHSACTQSWQATRLAAPPRSRPHLLLCVRRSGSIYAMTKAALNQLTKNLACEWAKDGVRANCVAPWYTATDLAMQASGKVELLCSTPEGKEASQGGWRTRHSACAVESCPC